MARAKLPTQKELDALYEAIDFVYTNADGAENHKPYKIMATRMRSLWKKLIAMRNKKKPNLP